MTAGRTVATRAYFDSSYLVRCYINEEGSDEVRAVARGFATIHSCALARVEIAAALRRRRLERLLSERLYESVLEQWRRDEASIAWHWIALSEATLELARATLAKTSGTVTLRAADAIHLASARLAGFEEIWSGDAKQRAAAPLFGLEGRHV